MSCLPDFPIRVSCPVVMASITFQALVFSAGDIGWAGIAGGGYLCRLRGVVAKVGVLLRVAEYPPHS